MIIKISDIIAPAFHDIYKDIKAGAHTHYMCKGGRGSTKSSFISIAVILSIKRNPGVHAVVFRKVAATLRDSVYAQYAWAISVLGLDSEFTCSVSPMQITYKPTGQRILFRGLDDWSKIKSIKAPFGYIGITHFEELDQFAGREEIRRVLQSTMRGGDRFWNFESFNPPISQANWANKDCLIERADRLVHSSNYLDVPREWLGQQFFDEAEFLRTVNEKAYRHEYMGEAVGTGGNVFENVVTRRITDDEINRFDRLYHGLDWGWYPDPTAYVKSHYDAARRVLYIFDEFKAFKENNTAIAGLLRQHGVTGNDTLICDSADPKSVADMKANGFRALGAEKGPGSVDYSMKWLQGLSQIVIDPVRCPHAADEFVSYEYERTRTGEIISGYPDKDNHFIDATRYSLNLIWRQKGR